MKYFILILFLFVCFMQNAFAQEYEWSCNAPGYVPKINDGLNTCYNKEKDLYIFGQKNFSIGKAQNRCGHHCDLDGRNCKVGVCNVEDCPKDKGYTKLQQGDGYIWSYFRCYNPKTKISYEESDSGVTSFYLNGKECGRGCDYEGKNCKSGVCNIKDCPIDKGYTQIKDRECYNPNILKEKKLNQYKKQLSEIKEQIKDILLVVLSIIKRIGLPLLITITFINIIYNESIFRNLLWWILLISIFIPPYGFYISTHIAIITYFSNKLKNTLLNKKSSKLLFSIICGIILFPSFDGLFGIYDDWNIGLMTLITPKGSGDGFFLFGWMCCLILTLIVWILFIVILFIAKKVKQARKNK